MKILGIEESVFFDPSIKKVIAGIAGSAKSTEIDNAFTSRGIEYLRVVPNNAQKRDCENRFSSECKTAASALTTNVGCHFYVDFKYPECKNIVVDEFAMHDKKILEWCIANSGDYNIIMTGDPWQLSAPENELNVKLFIEHCKTDPNTVYVELTKTKRPRTKKTAEAFYEYYEMAKEGGSVSIDDLPFKKIKYNKLKYNTNDAFVCRDNESEMLFYNDNNLSTRYDLADYDLLVPKGYIASKGTVSKSYPILPQKRAIDLAVRMYLQVHNVGSILRFQGQEVKIGSKLYFLVKAGSRISVRELYTLITRLWDIDDLIIVIMPSHNLTIKKHRGLPIYKERTAYINYLALLDEEHAKKA